MQNLRISNSALKHMPNQNIGNYRATNDFKYPHTTLYFHFAHL